MVCDNINFLVTNEDNIFSSFNFIWSFKCGNRLDKTKVA